MRTPAGPARQERQAEIAEPLPRRDGGIAVMMEFDLLPRPPFALGQSGDIADVVMGADEQRVVGIGEKRSDGGDLRRARLLGGAERIEADDDERIDAGEEFAVEGAEAGVRPAFGAPHGISRPRRRGIGEQLEIRQLYVVQKAADALIEGGRIGELLEARPEQPAQLEQRRKPVLQDAQRRRDLVRPAPGEIQRDVSARHGCSHAIVPDGSAGLP
ncbi:MAG: hypothetical protein WDN08_08790 [Rhizomicrobium sp.]